MNKEIFRTKIYIGLGFHNQSKFSNLLNLNVNQIMKCTLFDRWPDMPPSVPTCACPQLLWPVWLPPRRHGPEAKRRPDVRKPLTFFTAIQNLLKIVFVFRKRIWKNCLLLLSFTSLWSGLPVVKEKCILNKLYHFVKNKK